MKIYTSESMLLLVVVINLIISIGVFEINLRLQNRITSSVFMFITRKSLVLIFGGLMYLLFTSIDYFIPDLSKTEKINGVIGYLVVMNIYVFKYFFSRQKYMEKGDGGTRNLD